MTSKQKVSTRRDRARRLAGSLRHYAKSGTIKFIRAHVKREVARAAAAEGALCQCAPAVRVGDDAKDFRRPGVTGKALS